MNDRKLSERLETVEVPDERAAEERGWRVVRAAYEQRQPARRTRPRVRAAAIPVALALVALAVAASGTAVGDWLRDLARPGRKHAHPALSSLPGGGRLLVTSASGPWVVKPDGSKRLLGAYDSASWSPHGLFVVATRGQQLAAVEPNGRVRWTLARRAAIRDPRWSPSGYRIAYRTAGTLRVVAGDGTGDRLLARATAATPAAWKPGPGHVIAFARRDGSVLVVGADSRRTLARSEPGPRVEHVAWSADGRRLAVRTLRSLRILDASGHALRTIRTRTTAVAFAPHTHLLALARPAAGPDQSEVVLIAAEPRPAAPRPLFVGAGALTDLAWSPDGRWLLVGWPSADQWVFVRAQSGRRVVAVSNVGRQFNPGAPGNQPFPSVSGWCCTAAGPPG